MLQPLYQVDAFADRPFSGNPAAVCPLMPEAFGGTSGEFPPADYLQSIASEMNLSETAFTVQTGPASFVLRWFTPVAEVDLCGHATLAAAHVLFHAGLVAPGPAAHFSTRSGMLNVTMLDDGSYRMDFPSEPANEPFPGWAADPDLSHRLIGVPAVAAAMNRMDGLLEVATPADVRAAAPNMDAIAALPLRGLIVTAAGGDDADFTSRFFGPAVGVPEDPVTGSAHCALAPWWFDRLHGTRTTLRGYQASARGGFVSVEMSGDRVVLGGRAVTVLRGELLV